MSQEEMPPNSEVKGDPEKKRPVRNALKIVSEALQIGYLETKSFLSELGEISRDHPFFSIILAAGLGIGGYQLYKNGDDDKEQNKEKTSLLDGLTEADFKKPWEIGCILCNKNRGKILELLEKKDPQGKKMLLELLEKSNGLNLEPPYSLHAGCSGIDDPNLNSLCVSNRESGYERSTTRSTEDIFKIISLLGENGVRGDKTVDNVLLGGVEYNDYYYSRSVTTDWVRLNSTILLHKYGSTDTIKKAMKKLSKKVNCEGEDCPTSEEIDVINLEILRNLNAFQAVKKIALNTSRNVEVRKTAINTLVTRAWAENEVKSMLPTLKILLNDSNGGIRQLAMEEVIWIFPESAANLLFQRMNEDKSEELRIYAAMKLNEIGDPRGKAFIADGLREGKFKDPELAKEVLETIDNEKKAR